MKFREPQAGAVALRAAVESVSAWFSPRRTECGGHRKTPVRYRGGFTLLEMIIVLVIIAIMAGLSMPSIKSAFTEQGVRKDAHQLALMVKTAMIQAAEQNRPYVIDLTSKTIALHPAGIDAADPDAPETSDDADAATGPAQVNVAVTTTLDTPNQLQFPDAEKADKWDPVPDGTQWVFDPGELCPTTRIRILRGDAWIELTFSALTGNVEEEKNYLP